MAAAWPLRKIVLVFSVVTFWFALASHPASADLLLFYDFTDSSDASVAVDISGNGNDGEILGAEFTDSGGGRTGAAGDRALDFLDFNDSSTLEVVTAFDGALDTVTENDAVTIAFWLFGGDEQPVSQWTFWFGPGNRQLGSHVPWGDGTIYFDVQGCCDANQRIQQSEPDDSLWAGQWNHYAFVKDAEYTAVYQNGELFVDSLTGTEGPSQGEKNPLEEISVGFFGSGDSGGSSINGLMDDIGLWDMALTQDEIQRVMESGLAQGTLLQAGDADQNLEFNQLDLVQVQISAKYLTGQAATWGEGDWDGAPGGEVGNPPAGDGQFNQLDIIAALGAGKYLTGPYGAISRGGVPNDGQTSITYNPGTGELGVDAPNGVELTSVNIDSAAGIFTGDPAQNLGGSFDNDADSNIFKATFGSSFGTLSFGNVAQTGLSEDFVLNDLTVVGSLAGGGDLANVDLIYVPEPSSVVLIALGMLALGACGYRPRVRW